MKTEAKGVDLDVEIIGEGVHAPATNVPVMLGFCEDRSCRLGHVIRYARKPLQPWKNLDAHYGNGASLRHPFTLLNKKFLSAHDSLLVANVSGSLFASCRRGSEKMGLLFLEA